MHWNSFADFVHMGGYGLYVWGSYGAALVVMLIEPLLAAQRRRRAMADLAAHLGAGGAGMKPRHKKVAIAVGVLAVVGVGVGLILSAFNSNIQFSYTPTQIAAKEAPVGRTFRVGGLVQAGTVARDGVTVRFTVTDTAKTVPVRYEGILPDLFKEGKGVVAQGQLGSDGVFVAREVLAKHDENYMPPEAADAMQRAAKAKALVQAAR